MAEIGPFAKHESATRDHVRTLAERIETGLASAVEALESAGAARMPSSATYGVALAHVSAEVWANPAWTRAKSDESGSEERADEARESADFAASQVLMNVVPAHQAPYRAEVIIPKRRRHRARRGADGNRHRRVRERERVHRRVPERRQRHGRGTSRTRRAATGAPGTSHAIGAWTNRVIEGEDRPGARPIAAEIDPMAWAERWGQIMLRHARNGT